MNTPLRALLLAAGLGFASVTSANEPESFVVGVEELDYYPTYAVRDGEYVGAARDILDAFAADAGIRFNYQPMPIVRLTAELINGGIDFKFPDSPDWGVDLRRDAEISYSDAVIAYIDGVMVLPERAGAGLEGFRTLGTVTGFTPFAWKSVLEEGTIRLVENPQMRALQRQVLAGRVDGAYASVAVANYVLEHDLQQPGALVFDDSLPHARGHYLLSTSLHHELIERFNAWLSDNPERVQAILRESGAEQGVR